MQTGKHTSDSVGSESDTAETVNVSAADLTAQNSSLQNSSSSVKQDGRNSSSLDNTATSVTPLSRYIKPLFTLDAANGSSHNLNFLSLGNDLNRTDYVIQVVLVTLAVLVVIVLTVFFCKKHSKFWKQTNLRYYRCNRQVDILLDDMYDV
jgi:hypothetical protein